jgi:hypothetical protein
MDSLGVTNAADTATLCLTCDLAYVWIHECSLHGTLWDAEPTANVSLARTRMLQRPLDASKTYLRNLISVRTIHHTTFQTYTGWFYSTIVLVKLIFLHNNDISGGAVAAENAVPPEVSDLIARSGEDCVQNVTASLSTTSIHDLTTATGVGITQLFQSFIDMARAAAPDAGDDTEEAASLADRSVLWKVSVW